MVRKNNNNIGIKGIINTMKLNFVKVEVSSYGVDSINVKERIAIQQTKHIAIYSSIS